MNIITTDRIIEEALDESFSHRNPLSNMKLFYYGKLFSSCEDAYSSPHIVLLRKHSIKFLAMIYPCEGRARVRLYSGLAVPSKLTGTVMEAIDAELELFPHREKNIRLSVDKENRLYCETEVSVKENDTSEKLIVDLLEKPAIYTSIFFSDIKNYVEKGKFISSLKYNNDTFGMVYCFDYKNNNKQDKQSLKELFHGYKPQDKKDIDAALDGYLSGKGEDIEDSFFTLEEISETQGSFEGITVLEDGTMLLDPPIDDLNDDDFGEDFFDDFDSGIEISSYADEI